MGLYRRNRCLNKGRNEDNRCRQPKRGSRKNHYSGKPLLWFSGKRYGGVAECLRQRFATPYYSGSNPDAASIKKSRADLTLSYRYIKKILNYFQPRTANTSLACFRNTLASHFLKAFSALHLAICYSSATSQYIRGHQGTRSLHVDNPHVSELMARHQIPWSDRSQSDQQPNGDIDSDPLPVADHFGLYGDR